VAEGRGGVVKLSFTTDLVSNLQPTRGMKRRRTSKGNLTPAEALLWRALKNSSLEGKKFADNME